MAALIYPSPLLWGFGGGRLAYRFNNGQSIVSDYNDIHLTSGAEAAQVDSVTPVIQVQTVSRWTRDFGQDQHSFTHDPLFNLPNSNDFHVASVEGRYSAGAFVSDANTSLLVDGADAAGRCQFGNSSKW